MRMLILYSSRYGQTKKIAERMAETARRERVDVRAYNIASLPADVDLKKYDAVVMAGPIYYGKFRKPLLRFVKRHLPALAGGHNALVAVSLSAAFQKDEAEAYVHAFVTETGWLPETFTSVGGAESFTKYGLFTGYIMRKSARQQGRGGDFSRDREYTDWDAVDQFIREFAAKLTPVTSSVGAVQP